MSAVTRLEERRPMSSSTARVAHDLATRNTGAAADLVLDVAVKTAVQLLRDGQPGRAHYVLEALLSAGRILGERSIR
jgi:hypothetical protein